MKLTKSQSRTPLNTSLISAVPYSFSCIIIQDKRSDQTFNMVEFVCFKCAVILYDDETTKSNIVGPLMYTVCVDGLLWKRHVDHIKALASQTNQGDEFLNLNPPNSSTEPPSDHQPVNIETPDSSASGNTELRYPQRHRQPPNRLDPHS